VPQKQVQEVVTSSYLLAQNSILHKAYSDFAASSAGYYFFSSSPSNKWPGSYILQVKSDFTIPLETLITSITQFRN
jgi:hypothetical protein